jgi:AraC-like DNA-binding protein
MKALATADFASAAMVRALVQGMTTLGLQPPEMVTHTAQATVPLDLKRAVVQAAVAQGGVACLPLLGRGVHALAMEPTHLALSAGQQASALFTRWQRLERYIHSRHRVRMGALTAQVAQMSHVALEGNPPPMPVESLVVCGVLCALLEANGLTNVRAVASGIELYPHPDTGKVSDLVSQGATAHWVLDWQTADRPSPSTPALSWLQVAPPLWSALAIDTGECVAHHLPEPLRLDEASVKLGLSSRSLQRVLSGEGLSFTALQAEVRFRLAAWHLIQSRTPIAETGFVCGYADQAHMTREFSRRVGLPPLRYRELFEVSQPPHQSKLIADTEV